jgi:hypothetical protein
MASNRKEYPWLYGEEGEQYWRNYAKYSHVGCPGVQYEDNCPHPWDCAGTGCQTVLDQYAKHEEE